jgi:DNA-binding NarL/FixJ family response regulator
MPLQLSTSQQELIHLLAKGYPDSEIARKMALSRDQLQRAFSDICDRLNVADRIELILLIWSSDGFRAKSR